MKIYEPVLSGEVDEEWDEEEKTTIILEKIIPFPKKKYPSDEDL